MSTDSNAFLAYVPVPQRETVPLDGTPFEIEVEEIVDGSRLFELEKQREGRVKTRGTLKGTKGLTVSEPMAIWLTWLEFACVGVYERRGEERVKLADGLTYLQACERTSVFKDALLVAGMRAWAMTTGNLPEKKASTSDPSTASPESTE